MASIDGNSRFTHPDFGEHLTVRCGLAASTVKHYRRTIARFERWCLACGVDNLNPSPEAVASWAATLPRSYSTRKAAHMAVKWWAEWRGLPDALWEAVKLPREPRGEWRGLEPDDARLLRDAALLVGGRSGLVVLAGLYTAARASELAVLTWDGWDPRLERLRWWRSKTQEWHEVPVHPVLGKALAEYRAAVGDAHRYLFPGDRGRPHVTTQTVWTWVRFVAGKVGLSVSPHQLRATALTMVVDSTGNLRAAQEFAGHRNPQVTARYTRASGEAMRQAVSALDGYDPPGGVTT